MTLLAGHTVQVHLDEDTVDGDGNPVRRPGTTTVAVVGRWQYEAAGEDARTSQVTETATFRCRTWPAGYGARVTFDGRAWDVVGEPTRHGLSAATTHTVVRLRARAPR